MATAHLHAGLVKRSGGQSAVGAMAYAARARILDERTGVFHDYSRKSGDVMFSYVGLPKNAPKRLRDLAALANAMEARETRKDAQTARKFTLALPHELTPEQREWLVKDFGRENFTRRGLAFHVAIHRPDLKGDERNFHTHWSVSTRVLDKTGFTEKDRESDSAEALQRLRGNWERLCNRHLERHGHAARISMKTLEEQGIDRTPEIHLGQGASALERKGIETDRAAQLREIVNGNDRRRALANDNRRAVGKEIRQEPETIDRDRQESAWQEKVDAAGIDAAEERRRRFLEGQAAEREAVERHGQEMAARHAAAWNAALEHSTPATAYQPDTLEDAGQAMTAGFAFFLGWLASLAESITATPRAGTGRGSKTREREDERRRQQQKEQQQRELEGLLEEQGRERAQWERRRNDLLFEQARARSYYDEQVSERPSLQQEFDVHSAYVEAHREALTEIAEKKQAELETGRAGPQPGGPDLG